MFQNYLKVAFRNLWKRKMLSIINVLGLAIGIAACTIIFLYVRHELSYDLYNVKADRIARITTRMKAFDSDLVLATSPTPLADALKREFPEIETVVRLEASPVAIKSGQDNFREEQFYKADPGIFSVFDFDFLEGSATSALIAPQSIVITKSIAIKYFGRTAAIRKTMIVNGESLLVTGVVKDRPANTDQVIKGLLSTDFSTITKWVDDFGVYTYALFKSKPDLRAFAVKTDQLSAKYVQPELNKMGATEYRVKFETELLQQVHFSKGKLGDTTKGNRESIFIFSLLAIFILVIALLNYINLSTAKSAERALEVGIRKVSGARPANLMLQFMFESLVVILIAWLLGILFVILGLSYFNTLLDTRLSVNWAEVISFISIIFLGTVLLAGSYPAFVLSSFKPVTVLKGSWRKSPGGVWLRKTVSVTQFAIAAGLIMGTTVVFNQMKFIEQKDLGFNRDQLLNIYLPGDSASTVSVTAFRNDLAQRPEIIDITIGSGMTEAGMTIGTTFAETEGKKREMMCNFFAIDPRFIKVFQIKLLEGRNLSESFTSDKNSGFLVNEAFVKLMGWKSGVGKAIEAWDKKGHVVGVVKNFYYKSLHNVVEPMVMVYNTFPVNTFTVKIKPGDLPIVKTLFKKSFPSIAMDYAFFDEMINKQYKNDRITSVLFTGFTLLAIFVACLGLYGLVALIAIQRTKEIGVRKVLGATVAQLMALMTKDFMKLIIIALIIALPVSGFMMNRWLHTYAYHTPLHWSMFLVPVASLIIIALIMISREIVKAAMVNPIKTLKVS